ncbi:MAG: AAA family ATPase, partial [Clostridia bacterium]
MYISKLTLTNFRNYEKQTVDFVNGLNVVVGKNASGKTNLVESIYCSAIGKSPRTNKFRDLVRWGADYAHITIELVKKFRKYTIEFAVDNQDKKRVAIDKIPLTRISELLGIMNVVYFSP